ncbi:MAG: serine hydrolase domain-containing protein [Candidatus Hodarchaeales archaeon]|jgi:CubicO group peptidase (beta-lactamase class C family)
MPKKIVSSMIHGSVEPGFEKVQEEFIKNFEKRNELGAACAVYHEGKKVVDLWGGYRDKKSLAPWEEDTMVLVFSTSKGLSALAIAVAHSGGMFDYDEKVSHYWPEFSQNGKEDITVRQLLSHQAGLPAIDEKLDLQTLGDLDALASILAKQKPAWKPGTKHGYHAITLGWYESELVRRTDPQRRSMGQYFNNELAKPLDLEFYIGLPPDVPDSRIANLHAPQYKLKMIFNINKLPGKLVRAFLNSKSLTARAFSNPEFSGNPTNYNRRDVRSVEFPASNGIGLVRSIAKAYNVFAMGGKELDIKPETLEALTKPAPFPTSGPFDEVLLTDTCFSLGFSKPRPEWQFGSSEKAFGTSGLGGSFAYADPDMKLSFAYAMNKLNHYLFSDPREKALSDAAQECASKL